MIDVADRGAPVQGALVPAGRPTKKSVPSLTERLHAAQHALVRAEAATGVRTSAPTGARTGTRPRPAASLLGPAAAGDERFLPVPDALVPLVPSGGLRRGSVTQVAGSVTLLLDVAAAACRDGAWCAVVGMPDLGLAAAGETGLPLERMAFVPRPGPDTSAVLSAAVDGFDVVVVGDAPHLVDRDRRQISSRVRHRAAVLLTTTPWPGAELVLSAATRWSGPGQGDGSLRGRAVSVRVRGRGAAGGRGSHGLLRSAGGAPLVLEAPAAVAPNMAAPRSEALGASALDRGSGGGRGSGRDDVLEQRAG